MLCVAVFWYIQFERFYETKYTGRKLSWLYHMSLGKSLHLLQISCSPVMCCCVYIRMYVQCAVQLKPPNKGHYGTNDFVPCREVVPISEGPLSEAPLYIVFANVGFMHICIHVQTCSLTSTELSNEELL